MAGPGGGSRGGGFGGGSFGGSRGGGFSGGSGFGGGSFGGGFHVPHHHTHFGGWRVRRSGFGCSAIPIFLIFLFMAFSFIYSIADESPVDYEVNEYGIVYSEAVFQDYANEQYQEIFGSSSAYEDNILLVFLTNETADGYYTIAWIGDNVRSEINEMFGEYSEYGMFLDEYINTNYYAYTLDKNLSDVMNSMTNVIVSLVIDSSFYTKESHETVTKSHIINKTELDITEDIVNTALIAFTDKTDIPCVIVVDEAESVFGKNADEGNNIVGEIENVSDGYADEGYTTVPIRSFNFNIVSLAVICIVIVVLIFIIIKAFNKTKKKPKEKEEKPPWEY